MTLARGMLVVRDERKTRDVALVLRRYLAHAASHSAGRRRDLFRGVLVRAATVSAAAGRARPVAGASLFEARSFLGSAERLSFPLFGSFLGAGRLERAGAFCLGRDRIVRKRSAVAVAR